MSILMWILFGSFVGTVASFIVPTRGDQSIATNIVVGIVGAFLGKYVMSYFGGGAVTGFNIQSIFVAMVGSVALLLLMRLFGK